MPVPLRRSQLKKYTPKEIRFSDIYKHGANATRITSTRKTEAKKALKEAGFRDSEISKAIYGNKAIPVAKMKEMAEHLNKARIYGFSKTGDKLTKDYIKHEATKRINLEKAKHERAIEARQETISGKPTTKPITRGRKVNLFK